MLEDMPDHKPEYRSYVLRLWVVREEDHWVWRASLQHIPDGLKRGFIDLHSMFAFLEEQTRPPESFPPSYIDS